MPKIRNLTPDTIDKYVSLAALFLLANLGLQFRLDTIDFRYFSMDEIIQYKGSLKDFRGLIDHLWHFDVHPPGFYLLTSLWTRLTAPYDPNQLKLLTVTLGTLGILSTYAASVRLWGWTAGLASAAFIAFSPIDIAQSTNFRMYCGFALGAGLFHWALAELTNPESKKLPYTLLLTSCFFLGWFNHLTLLYQLGLTLLWLFLARKSLAKHRIQCVLFTVGFANLIPLVFFVKHSFFNAHHALDWIPRFTLVDMLRQFVGTLIWQHPPHTPHEAALLLIPFILLGLWFGLSNAKDKIKVVLLMTGVLLVPLILIGKSLVGSPIFYWRYTSISYCALAILIGVIIFRLERHRIVKWIVCLSIVSGSFWGHSYFYNFVVKHQWKELIRQHEVLFYNDYYTCLENEFKVESEFHFKMHNLMGQSLGDICDSPELIQSLPNDFQITLIANPHKLQSQFSRNPPAASLQKLFDKLAYSVYFLTK